jgi:hypothetical protein
MKNRIWTYLIGPTVLFTMLAFTGCGGESPTEESASATPEGAAEALTQDEESALKDEYALEALETIDGNNARAEAEKLAAEIDADQ